MGIVQAKDLTFEYIIRDEEDNIENVKTAVDHVSLDIEQGQFIAILGHNGSGKSTFAKHINALLSPTEGTIWVDGMDTKDEAKLWDIRQTAGMVFQNPDNQIIGTIVEEDVGFGPENLGVPTEEIWERVDASLEAVGMTEYRHHSPNKLSGGQKQRVAIAGILAMKPKCIVLDEPTAMLDPNGRKEVIATITKLNKEEHVTVILITHYMDEVIPFANKDEGTVYEHLKRAIDFSMNHLGKHSMPAGLYADWNDCLRLGKDGESTFVAFQFYYAMTILRIFAEHKKDTEYTAFLDENQKKLGNLIQELCWDEDRFIRGFTESGETIGKRTDPEANMWLNPQSWAVISGLADEKQADCTLQQVYDRLNTEYGAILMDPPYHEHAFDGALAVIYNAGTKENAGIFSQSQGWIILAEALRGHGERAFTYFMENAPAAQNDKAEIRRLEPYCYGQFTEGKDSPNFGRSHVHWLTGTASTVMVGCVEGILGMRPDLYGLRIAPSIPKEWELFEIDKDFRGCHLHITVKNPGHAESGCKKLFVNGQEMKDNYIPQTVLTDETDIELIMS